MNKKLIIILFALLFIPISVFASDGFSLSVSNITIYKGNSATFDIISNNSVGRLDITIDNENISLSDKSIFIENPNDKKTITIKGLKKGKTTISISTNGNYASYDGEYLINDTKYISINVIEKEIYTYTKSSNNKLKSISVDNYDLEYIDDNNYELNVSNDVESININVTSEDEKATISGNGKHLIEVGKNNIEIVITSEDGNNNVINILVVRKDKEVLNNNLSREDIESNIKEVKNNSYIFIIIFIIILIGLLIFGFTKKKAR